MRKLALLGFTFVVCLIMALAGVYAQDEMTITPGDTVSGTITAGSNGQMLYTFNGTQGSQVVITLSSNDFDAYLVLVDANGNVLREDDDSGGRLNAQITFTLPSTGRYTIIATSLRAYRSNGQFISTGNFTLSLTVSGGSQQPVPTPTQPPLTPTRISPTPTPTIAFGTPLPPTPTTPPVSSTVVGEIAYGEQVTATIPPDFTQQQYRFTADAGDTVEITLVSDDFDSYLFLYDAAGNILTQDDDGAGMRNARIIYTIPTRGDYIIGVDSFGNVVGINPAFGTFTLTLNLQGTDAQPSPTAVEITPTSQPIETTPTPQVSAGNTIRVGETVSGRVTSEVAEVNYTFIVEEDQVVAFSLYSDEVDTYLILKDSEGNIIDQNDDSGGTLNSRIGPLQVTQGVEYTVVASTYSYVIGGEYVRGRFELRVEAISPMLIAYGERVTGQLNRTDADQMRAVYAFEGEAGQIISLDLITAGYALYAQIVGPNGRLDQSTSGGQAVLGPIMLTENGLYVILIDSFDLVEPTNFSFVVDSIEPSPIVLNEPISNRFTAENTVYVYTFEAKAGMGVDITVTSNGTVDTRMTLTAPSGDVIASDDDSGVGFDPELMDIILSEDGTYSLLVQPFIRGDTGEFTVSINTSRVMMLNEQPLTIRLSTKASQGVGIFEGKAGETVLLGVRVITGAESEPFITVTQGGEVLATQSIGTVRRLLIELQIPADGPVLVTVDDANYGNSVIEFSVQR